MVLTVSHLRDGRRLRGLPQPRPDHAQAVAELALAMREEVARRSDSSGGQPLQVRIGIGTGPVEAA